MTSSKPLIAGSRTAAAQLLALVAICFTHSANSLANPLVELPEIASAKEGMQLIFRDTFGPLSFVEIAAEVEEGSVYERTFSTNVSSEDLYHGISLTAPFGRITLGYMVAVDNDSEDAWEVFNLTKKEVVDYFEALDVGGYKGNEKLNDIQREYKWKWASGPFECEAKYEYWECTQPYFYYVCTLQN